MEDLIISAENIWKTYSTGEAEVAALKGVDLRVERGDMIAIMGPSGCGKTTLLNCLSGIDDIDSGSVIIDDLVLHKLEDDDRSDFRAKNMGFVFQLYNLLPVLNAVENIESILSHDEIDAVMIGPYDISGSLGVPGQLNHPDVINASKKVIKACEKYGKSCGTQLNDPNLKNIDALFELGYTFAILGSDLFILWKWAEAMKEVMTNFKKNAN